ncbi:hypothetical protein C2E25_16725 [Geothermobacter hydrogeniphilus]|uniref:Uncharacterized protein n=1 Tax=Geothermobacter hydrogeniphilus TaxID=1969733 RepID=A0A2K2H5M7_9BACT|nr:hypothetical protein C2E25_16725 [Geothermobacter hydrogeniphilus]
MVTELHNCCGILMILLKKLPDREAIGEQKKNNPIKTRCKIQQPMESDHGRQLGPAQFQHNGMGNLAFRGTSLPCKRRCGRI